MQKLQITEYQGVRVLTSKLLAECYGTTSDVIGYNYRYNKQRYQEGKHYIALEGQALREFKSTNVEIQRSLPRISKLYLWTEKGALLHAKSLNTDKAWQVYDYLVDFYFRVKEKQEETKPVVVETKPTIQENKKEEQLPHMNNPIRILKVLLEVAEEKGISVNSYPFKYNNSVLKGNKIGIRTQMTLEKVTYELAWELAHVFIHFDGGDMINSPLSKEYNAQATRAANMIINVLNIKMNQM